MFERKGGVGGGDKGGHFWMINNVRRVVKTIGKIKLEGRPRYVAEKETAVKRYKYNISIVLCLENVLVSPPSLRVFDFCLDYENCATRFTTRLNF